MQDEDRFQLISEFLDGKILGGTVECQEKAAKWIITFLASIKDYQEIMSLDWMVVIPSRNSSAQQLHFFGNRSPWFIIINGKPKEEDGFIYSFAHELAHVYYGDDENTPPGVDHMLWASIVELRADLKVEQWGALRIKENSYLYCTDWVSHFGGTIPRNESLHLAKIEDNAEILSQLAQKYPKEK